jgi:hypothetical protein
MPVPEPDPKIVEQFRARAELKEQRARRPRRRWGWYGAVLALTFVAGMILRLIRERSADPSLTQLGEHLIAGAVVAALVTIGLVVGC